VADPILKLESLRKNFGGLRVTDDVTLEIAPGEVHAIIGPNGGGKTTLLNEISGLLAVDAGRILFDGNDVTMLPAHRRTRLGIARSFQVTSIIPGFSVRENVTLAVQARSGGSFRFFWPAARERRLDQAAREALEQVGLIHRANVPAGLLSHGEKRSLELAIALALDPKLLLLDEPMAGTGRAESEQLIATLGALKGRFTLLLVEHDMRAVFALADRVTVQVYGRAIATGTPEAIRANAEVRTAYLGEEAA
jgi:branched-chain amino acid transport system ATP-binding protein